MCSDGLELSVEDLMYRSAPNVCLYSSANQVQILVNSFATYFSASTVLPDAFPPRIKTLLLPACAACTDDEPMESPISDVAAKAKGSCRHSHSRKSPTLKSKMRRTQTAQDDSVFQPSSYLLVIPCNARQDTPDHKRRCQGSLALRTRSLIRIYASCFPDHLDTEPVIIFKITARTKFESLAEINPAKLYSITTSYLKKHIIEGEKQSVEPKEKAVFFNTVTNHKEFMELFYEAPREPKPYYTPSRPASRMTAVSATSKPPKTPVKPETDKEKNTPSRARKIRQKMSTAEAKFVKRYLEKNFSSRQEQPKTLLDWQLSLSSSEKQWDPKEFRVCPSKIRSRNSSCLSSKSPRTKARAPRVCWQAV
jgi:hypothetical protein